MSYLSGNTCSDLGPQSESGALKNKYIVYILNGDDRPLFWLGNYQFSPYLNSALCFDSVEQARKAVKANTEFPLTQSPVKALTVSEAEKFAEELGFTVWD